MIVEYSRPKTVSEAIELLSRPAPQSVPIAGGTGVRRKARQQDIAVVDLQDLDLAGISLSEDWIEIGAMASLNAIANHPQIPAAMSKAIQFEGTSNTRNQATIGGRLVAYNGRSALITTLIAADAITVWDNNKKEELLGEWMALPDKKPGKLLVSVKVRRKVSLGLEIINKTKLDLPILCVAVAGWKNGRVRLAVGGFGKCPQMAFDGPNADGAEVAVENACRKAEDIHASSDYRRAMSVILTRRCLEGIRG
jgi:probable selenate reductase FAD-binding subunit